MTELELEVKSFVSNIVLPILYLKAVLPLVSETEYKLAFTKISLNNIIPNLQQF